MYVNSLTFSFAFACNCRYFLNIELQNQFKDKQSLKIDKSGK